MVFCIILWSKFEHDLSVIGNIVRLEDWILTLIQVVVYSESSSYSRDCSLDAILIFKEFGFKSNLLENTSLGIFCM